MAVSEASREAVYLKSIIEELDEPKEAAQIYDIQRGEHPIQLFCDNQGAIKLSSNPAFHRRTKHINISYHAVREFVERRIGEDQLR